MNPLQQCQTSYQHLTETVQTLRTEKDNLSNQLDILKLNIGNIERLCEQSRLKTTEDAQQINNLSEELKANKALLDRFNQKIQLLEKDRQDLRDFIDAKLLQFGILYQEIQMYSDKYHTPVAPITEEPSTIPPLPEFRAATGKITYTRDDPRYVDLQNALDNIVREFNLKAFIVAEQCKVGKKKICDSLYRQYKNTCSHIKPCRSTNTIAENIDASVKLSNCIKERLKFAEHCTNYCIDPGHTQFVSKVYDTYTTCRKTILPAPSYKI